MFFPSLSICESVFSMHDSVYLVNVYSMYAHYGRGPLTSDNHSVLL